MRVKSQQDEGAATVGGRIAHPALGVALMGAAMLMAPAVDGLAKYLSTDHAPLFLAWARYVSASLFVLPWAVARHGRHFLPPEDLAAHGLRTFFLAGAMSFYFLGIAVAPLADVTSAYFVGPVIATGLAVMLLGEKMTVRKALSLTLGAAGTFIVVNPTGSLNSGLLFGVASGALYAFYIIATRKASRNSDPVKTLAMQCLLGSVILLPQALWTWSMPTQDTIWLLLAMGLLSAVSHAMAITGFRHAEASLLAPLVYLELVGAIAIGYLFFADLPGARVLFGAAVIVAAGLMLWQRRMAATIAEGEATK